VLFVAKSVALGLFVASWFARRAGKRNAERNKLLRRLHLLTPPMQGELHVASYEQGHLQLSPVEDALVYELVVVDEAHHVYSHPELRECVKPYADAASHLLLLSDASQSLGALCEYPTGLKEVALTEVVRSSQRIVTGANAFRCDFDARGAALRSEGRPRCHHQVPGPPLLPILFDNRGKKERMVLYASRTVDALKRVHHDFQGLRLHNRLALIVPDATFRKDFMQPLQQAFSDAFKDVRFHLINAEEASACVLGMAAEPGKETLVLDTVEQFDGLERLIVIAIGLDAPIVKGSDTTLETRSRLYRALTRAHMMALVVNEKLRGGWLEFLGNVKFDGLDAGAYDAEAQESKQSNAAAVITAETLAIRDEVHEAAKQRKLSLAPVVHDAIVRQVQRVTTGDATAALKITTALDLCEEKLPAIGVQLQAALAASSYCSEALTDELQPDVMLAVLDGEEVAAAVQKVVVRAEEKVVGQVKAATPVNREVVLLQDTTGDGEATGDGSVTAAEQGERPFLTLTLYNYSIYNPNPNPNPSPKHCAAFLPSLTR
jgi:hypothetical protein